MSPEQTLHKYTKPATLDDAINIAHKLRPEDTREIITATGNLPITDLTAAILNPAYTNYAIVSPATGETFAIFGTSTQGIIWMVSTPEITKHCIPFLKASRTAIQQLHKTHKTLCNIIDSRNTLHIKWLTKWLGFKITGYTTIKGIKFYKIQHKKEEQKCVTP